MSLFTERKGSPSCLCVLLLTDTCLPEFSLRCHQLFHSHHYVLVCYQLSERPLINQTCGYRQRTAISCTVASFSSTSILRR